MVTVSRANRGEVQRHVCSKNGEMRSLYLKEAAKRQKFSQSSYTTLIASYRACSWCGNTNPAKHHPWSGGYAGNIRHRLVRDETGLVSTSLFPHGCTLENKEQSYPPYICGPRFRSDAQDQAQIYAKERQMRFVWPVFVRIFSILRTRHIDGVQLQEAPYKQIVKACSVKGRDSMVCENSEPSIFCNFSIRRRGCTCLGD